MAFREGRVKTSPKCKKKGREMWSVTLGQVVELIPIRKALYCWGPMRVPVLLPLPANSFSVLRSYFLEPRLLSMLPGPSAALGNILPIEGQHYRAGVGESTACPPLAHC